MHDLCTLLSNVQHCCNNGENYIVLNTFQHSSQQILTKERRKHNFISKQQKKSII